MSEKLRYTPQSPTVPGWYFHKLPHWNSGFVIQLYAQHGYLWVVDLANDEVTRLPLSEFLEISKHETWLWAGPIPEPSEKAQVSA